MKWKSKFYTASKKLWTKGFLSFKTKLIGTEGTRLLQEKRGKGRPRRRKERRGAPGTPAESECLKWKSTLNYKIYPCFK
ncbi:hypothetical protein CQ056_00075 [Peribacillus simplex]|nr:hypothetical protein CQ056_00075 [Peribacillus simplex]